MKKFILKAILKWSLAILLALIILLSAFSAGAFLYQKKYENKIYPGVKIGSLELSGKTLEEAKQEIQKIVDARLQQEIVFSYQPTLPAQTDAGKQADENIYIPISPILTSAADPSLTKEILSYNIVAMVKTAYTIGREKKTKGENFLTQLSLLKKQGEVLPVYALNAEEIIDILKNNLSSEEQEAKNAELMINDNFDISIKEEESGVAFNYEIAIFNLIKNLDRFSDEKINIALEKKKDEPEIKKNEILPAIDETKKLLNIAPFTLNCKEKTWDITKKKLKEWIILKCPANIAFQNVAKKSPFCCNNGALPNSSGANLECDIHTYKNSNNYEFIDLSKEKIIEYLKKEIAPDINIAPQNAKFEIKDGKVIEFQTSKDGLELNLEKNYEYIKEQLMEGDEKNLNLIVADIKSMITTENINNMGIKEIISIGESSFKGSPANRRHNIKIGAAAINGLLIKPMENFSLVNALGNIDAENGYLPELVIKGNKTLPEYGGGLCQIGTTLFRAALNAGFPIIERQNHAYRVSYYEPAGTDATIYNPKPDVIFLNDTNHYILIQTRIEGDNLIFEFWGTNDGRIVEMKKPRIFNIVKPGPTKYIETEDLEPGKEKCTETSHNGADAELEQKITYADRTIKDNIFKSHYKPWQAVCLVGKEPSEIQNTASTTAEIVN